MSDEIKSTSKEVKAIKDEANEELPISEEDKQGTEVDKSFQDEQGRIIARANKESNKPEIHPMSRGLRSAKAVINEILKDTKNLEKLHITLQTEFDKNPIKFLKEFGPLLEKYESMSGDHSNDEDRTVRLFQRGGETAIEIGRKK